MGCPDSVESVLRDLPGVQDVTVDLAQDTFAVRGSGDRPTDAQVFEAIADLGFTPSLVDHPHDIAPPGQPPQAPPTSPALAAALVRARTEHKLLVLDFVAPWCGPCQQMKRSTWPAPEVRKLLEKFVFVEVDSDADPDTAAALGVTGLPDVRVLDGSGVELARLRGAQDARAVANVLARLLTVRNP